MRANHLLSYGARKPWIVFGSAPPGVEEVLRNRIHFLKRDQSDPGERGWHYTSLSKTTAWARDLLMYSLERERTPVR